jgi:hypothetical protein
MKIFQPMLFVGLGGTGGLVGTELERRLRAELCGPDGTALTAEGRRNPYQLPDCLQYVYADYSESELARLPHDSADRTLRETFNGTARATHDLLPADYRSSPDVTRMLRAVLRDEVTDWLPPCEGEPRGPLRNGTGQLPTIGRAALFDILGEGPGPVVEPLRQSIDLISCSGSELEELGGGPTSGFPVFVAFSVAGGTGAGIFFDYLDLIGQTLQDRNFQGARICPLVVTPSAFPPGGGGRAAELNAARAVVDVFHLVDQQTVPDAEANLGAIEQSGPLRVRYPGMPLALLQPGTVPATFLFSHTADFRPDDDLRQFAVLATSLIRAKFGKSARYIADDYQKATMSDPVSRTILLLDIERFSDRDDVEQAYLQRLLYDMLDRTLENAGIDETRRLRTDRGDSVIVADFNELLTAHQTKGGSAMTIRKHHAEEQGADTAALDDFGALLQASSLGAPHVLAATEPLPPAVQSRLDQATRPRHIAAHPESDIAAGVDAAVTHSAVGPDSARGQYRSPTGSSGRPQTTAAALTRRAPILVCDVERYGAPGNASGAARRTRRQRLSSSHEGTPDEHSVSIRNGIRDAMERVSTFLLQDRRRDGPQSPPHESGLPNRGVGTRPSAPADLAPLRRALADCWAAQHTTLPLRIHTDEHDTGRVLPARFIYRTMDPYAIEVVFGPHRRGARSWVFARDLLLEGLHRSTGEGNVIVWPRTGPTSSSSSTFIRLKSPQGTALLSASQADLENYLEQTQQAVPSGAELQHMSDALNNLERELAALTSGTVS